MRSTELPPFFARYYEIGGVIEFHVFAEVAALTEVIALDAIVQSVPDIDRNKLRAIGCRELDDQIFLGEWYDPLRNALIDRGTRRTSDGRVFENAILVDLDGIDIAGGATELPDPGSGGNFAYAFSKPPYGLRARPAEVQRIFDSIKMYLLPPRHGHKIMDWSDPRLPEASAFFGPGMEWWGVFLFVVFVPDFQRLVVVLASTTD